MGRSCVSSVGFGVRVLHVTAGGVEGSVHAVVGTNAGISRGKYISFPAYQQYQSFPATSSCVSLALFATVKYF